MPRLLHPQFRDELALVRYPFADTATLLTTAGIDLGADTFLDATVYPVGGSVRMYVSSVLVTSSVVIIYIGTAIEPQLCHAAFNTLSPPDNLKLTDAYGRDAGLLVSEPLRLARFQAWSHGTHTFEIEASELAASVCIPTPEIGVRGVITKDGDVLYGDVWIVGEQGAIVTEDTDSPPPNSRVVRIDLVGDPLFKRYLCDQELTPTGGTAIKLFTTKSYLKTINGIPPDEYGNFTISVGSNHTSGPIIRITPEYVSRALKVEVVGNRSGNI